jgi:hypothetical protein
MYIAYSLQRHQTSSTSSMPFSVRGSSSRYKVSMLLLKVGIVKLTAVIFFPEPCFRNQIPTGSGYRHKAPMCKASMYQHFPAGIRMQCYQCDSHDIAAQHQSSYDPHPRVEPSMKSVPSSNVSVANLPDQNDYREETRECVLRDLDSRL